MPNLHFRHLLTIPIPRVLIGALLLFVLTNTAEAQINNNRFRVGMTSHDMGPCGGANDARTWATITAKNNTVHNFEIAFDLPDGVDFVPGSEQIVLQQGSSDFTLTVVDISNLNAPVFRLERPGDANWEVADQVRFRFYKTASCDAVNYSYNGGLFKDAHTITYDDLNGPQSASDNDPTINSYNFLRAYLAVLNYNNIPAEIGDIVTRTLDITNSGNGSLTNFVHNVTVDNNFGSYTLSFNGTTLTPTTVAGNVYTYTIDLSAAPFLGNVGDGDGIFENETIALEESFEVLSCGSLTVGHQPTWGCSAVEICQQLPPVTAAVVLDTGLPQINVTNVLNPSYTELCGTTTYTARIANDASSAIAYNVEINTGFGVGSSSLTTPTQNGLWGNDRPDNSKSISNLRLGGNPFTPDIRPNTQFGGVGAGSYFIGRTTFISDPDGPGGLEDLDGDGFFDDLAAGASTELTYDYSNQHLTRGCGTNNIDYIRGFAVFVDAYANNQCDVSSDTYRHFLNNPNFSRRPVDTSSPTDIFDGSSFTVGVQGRMGAGGSDPPRCNGQLPFSNDPSSRWTVTLTVPNGILLDGSPVGFTQVDPNTIVFSTTDLNSGNYFNMNVQFPLTIDCSAYSGPQIVPISYVTRYECSCFVQDIHCGTIEGIRSQCPVVCDGPTITSFEAQRETAGWTDNTMSTKVILDSNSHNLETYMARDEMVINTSAVMDNTNPDNLWFDLTYSTESASAGGSDVIQFLNGAITINDLSSGAQSTALTVTPTIITDSPNNYRLRFDLSSYATIISPTYTYGEPNGGGPEPDVVDLVLHFAFNDNFTERNLYELSNFSGEFFTNSLLGAKVPGCTILGDRAFYFKNRLDAYVPNNPESQGCEVFDLQVNLAIQTVTDDQFPNEYRPPALFTSLDVEIPTGAEYLGVATSNFVGSPSSSNGGLIVTVAGNTVSVAPGPSFRNFDQQSDDYPRIQLQMRGSSLSPPTSNFNWVYNYENYAYADATDAVVDSGTNTFNFEQPAFLLSSPQPIVSGDRATAIYEVDLCMDNPTDIDFNWLQVANGTNFTVLNAYEVIGAARNSLVVTQSAGNTWIEMGQFTAGTGVCKKVEFEIDFTQCSAFNFEVSHAWDCGSYPSDFSTANYINPINLRLEPKEAVLQMAILNEPGGPVDVCSNFDIAVEIRNAGTGNLTNPTLRFEIPGDATSLSLNQVDVEYPQGSGDIQAVSSNLVGSTVTINLTDHTAIGANAGIQGSINAPTINSQIAIIQLDLSVQCNFTSNTAITYTANGENPCGSPATGDGSRLSTNPIIVNGAIPFYDAVSTLSVPNGNTFSGCNAETIAVESVVVGGPTGNTDFARIILPDGLQYEPGSFVATTTNVATFNSVTVVGSHEEILLNMPSGVNNGEIIGYTLDITPKNEPATCNPNARIEVRNFVTTTSLSCFGVSCGTSEIPTGDTFEDVIIQKPELAETTLAATASYDYDYGNATYDYSVEFGIENTGVVDLAPGFTYDVYCSDGAGGKAGLSIYTGSIAQAIVAGSSITENVTFTASNFCGPNNNIIVELVPSASNCHCDVLAIEVTVDDIIDPVINNCPSDITITNTDPGTCGAMVSWTPPTATDNSGIATLTTNNYNSGDEFLPGTTEVIYTATDPNGNTATCSFNVTVVDAVDPEINGPGNQTLNNDPGNCTAVYNYTLSASDNCMMSTGTYPIMADFEEGDRGLLRAECWQFWGSVIRNASPFTPGIYSFHTQEIINAESRTLVSPLTYFNGTGQVIFEHRLENRVGNNTRLTVSLEDEGGVITPIYNYVYVNTSLQNVVIDITQTGNYRVRFDFDTDGGGTSGRRARLDNLLIPGIDLSDTTNNPSNFGVCGLLDFVITQTSGLPSGAAFPVGITTNTFEVLDAYGNVGTYSFDVEVIDNENPTASNPAPLSFECLSDVPAPDLSVVLDEADNCAAPTVAFVSESSSGVNPVVITRIYSVTDGAGNSIQVQQDITVQDSVDPTASDPAPLTVSCPVDVPAPDPTVVLDENDNCTLTPIVTFMGEISDGNSNPELITRTYSVADDAGNAITVQQLITVNDVDAPIPNVAPLPDVMLACGEALTVIPEATDNCMGTIVGVSSDALSYDVEGTYTITWTYDDGNGNTSQQIQNLIVSCSVDIEIIKTVEPVQAVIGDTVVFTITASNLSAIEGTNIGVEEIIPNGFVLVSSSASIGAYDEGTSTWEIPSLDGGASASLEITATVASVDETTNVAALIFMDQIDPNPSNDRDEATVEVTQSTCLTVFNEFSPNDDGANDLFFIECIEQYPDNILEVFNRWGTKVFEMRGYDNSWDGTSMGRATLNTSEKLPVGTYYYTLNPNDGTTPPKAGWLYISR
ncbi:HYR domain-containing protein [Flavobacteriaceae bacterium TP-CH-4]|uniref:HYR domain-containing protein n=1 Tax=Pelagihabitans pacificus TaxID=2696054 RepID=A0A967AU58_9FLAO|nr:gliding motility-associated C-terminal domain-containing protein [Pelagihabitans pacificus]NHF59068.1 HYR domain-containing protein [Pelagihabitans pacificus]